MRVAWNHKRGGGTDGSVERRCNRKFSKRIAQLDEGNRWWVASYESDHHDLSGCVTRRNCFGDRLDEQRESDGPQAGQDLFVHGEGIERGGIEC